MTKIIDEKHLRFEFSDDWHVIKYDDHPDYRDQIRKLNETKGVDFAAIQNARILFLIEVKDFRGSRIEYKEQMADGKLVIKVGQKVRDTIAGIVAAHHRGKIETWSQFVDCLTRQEPPVQVVLWLEDELPPRPLGRRANEGSVIMNALKKQLKWLTTKIFVCSIASGSIDGIAVSNLPGAGGHS